MSLGDVDELMCAQHPAHSKHESFPVLLFTSYFYALPLEQISSYEHISIA